MVPEDILIHKSNVFTQNGEDGIVQHIFERIGAGGRVCCEFGAWDGIHFSNCRNLILQGWQAVMIEGDHDKYTALAKTYKDNPSVKTIHRFVDTANNRLDHILNELEVDSLDFLSIDIDGLDYEILESINMRPRVICVEVNAGHDPRSQSLIPSHIAKENVGQPLEIFVRTATEKGYNVVCYTGNAFFVLQELCERYSLPSLSSQVAYASFLKQLSNSEREWLYLVNVGIVPPYHQFHNPHLDAAALGMDRKKAFALRTATRAKEFIYKRARPARHLLQ